MFEFFIELEIFHLFHSILFVSDSFNFYNQYVLNI